jgi:hypothetical protein
MMRSKTSASLQKTYDECYLICSTAVYFEGQVRIPGDSEPLKHGYSADIGMEQSRLMAIMAGQ